MVNKDKIFEIGDVIYIGDNSYITRFPSEYNPDHEEFFYLVGTKVTVLGTPVVSDVHDSILGNYEIARIPVKTDNGDMYYIDNSNWHYYELEEVLATSSEIQLLAKQMEEALDDEPMCDYYNLYD